MFKDLKIGETSFCEACEAHGTGGLKHTCGIEPKETNKIIERFKEKFRKGDYVPLTNVIKDIEQFIIEEFEKDRKTLCEEIEKFKKKAIENPMMKIKNNEISEIEAYNSVFNQAIDEVINIINK